MIGWCRRVWHLLNRPRHERELVREMNEHREAMHDPSKFGWRAWGSSASWLMASRCGPRRSAFARPWGRNRASL